MRGIEDSGLSKEKVIMYYIWEFLPKSLKIHVNHHSYSPGAWIYPWGVLKKLEPAKVLCHHQLG
jgi:hypothetical protein